MLTPVKLQVTNVNIETFVVFKSEADAKLQGRSDLREFAWTTTYADPKTAWKAADKQRLSWTNWIQDNMDGQPDPTPIPVTVRPTRHGRWELISQVYVPKQDRPLGRTVTEAMENPIDHLPLLDRPTFEWKGHVATRKSVCLPAYARHSTVMRKYRQWIQCGAATVEQGLGGRYHARLTFWRLPAVALPRDREAAEQGENFDLWYHAPKDEHFSQDVGPSGLPEEGSGRPMGV